MPESKSPAIAEMKEGEVLLRPDYDPDQILYLAGLQKRLEIARLNRDTQHDELDGMDYTTRYEDEERLANSFIPPKKNKTDTNFISGTIRHKMLALLSAVNMLNLEPEYSAYDRRNILVDELGDALGVVRKKTEEIDEDEEKRLMRQEELLKHGHVFVEDIWKVEYRKGKTLNKKFDGQVTGVTWSAKQEKNYENPCRTVLDGRSVYLGDIRQPFITKQPYIFTVDEISYEEAQAIYGEWEMWKYVGKKVTYFAPESTQSNGIAYGNWRLRQTQENRVEIIKYQDKWSNEFQIILNGIPMLPIGFPMPWNSGEYNITQQNLEFIHPHFAYGRSFVSRLKVQAALLDEMLRLIILKTQKSFMPPRANNTGRVLSKNIFMPGVITMGINPDQIKELSEQDGEGLLKGELETLRLISENIDQNSVNPTFAGQQTKGTVTATEILELQRQAKMMLGLTIFSMSMLEKKLGQMRLFILLENWFNPVDTEVDKARNMLKNIYRTASVEKNLEGQGMGNMMVIPTEESNMFSTEEESMNQISEDIYRDEKKSVMPTRKLYLNVKELKNAKLVWKVVVNPTEASGSERSKQLFERMIQSANSLQLPLSPEYIQERFAQTWQENPNKMFQQQQVLPPGVVAAGINPGGSKPKAPVAPPMMPAA